MERIELVELTAEEATYKYIPEEAGGYGLVTVNRRTGERTIRQKAGGYGSEYAFHALREIERYIKRGEFKKEGIVAWY